MTENVENSYLLTHPYQAIFILDLKQINECFFMRNYQDSFEALRVLYSDLLEKPRADIEKDWNAFLQEKMKITAASELSHRRTFNYQRNLNNFLYANIPEIKAKFIHVLEKHKLLNIDYGAKPKYPHKGHLTVPK